jgi:acyl-CoA synthetase (AMP-forming)/AMP-acid ligase II
LVLASPIRRRRLQHQADGWFNTRDLARLENGYLFVVGRTKELIVRFGENVYPAEVEAVLNSHPATVRSAVIGRPVAGAEGDEEVVAFVQLLPSSPPSGRPNSRNTPHNISHPTNAPHKFCWFLPCPSL